ncbi:tRNA (adenosine(37)-N6)-threonylcarbamoyltransferase complex ATPase subunit type 1 TsaE [Synergistaceae bacterium OttesenSCG-928-I11]|nr:tRNA (adenosine(37)-N6)-threonylcarbamoyltransferase complex ATPase subunit type 1 TsaE [Synergistaceae bacterium OttesenSCG-928-I11]
MPTVGLDLVCKFPGVATDGPDGTAAVGRSLSKAASAGLLILLYGPLGAGKTLLSVSIGESLGASRMKSPSFAIESIHSLPGKNFSLVHADLYRLEDTSSEAMQLEEYLDDGAIVLVEWAERWKNPPRHNRWDVHISAVGETKRTIDFAVHGEGTLAAFSNIFSELLSLCR